MGAYWLNDCIPTLQQSLGSKFKLYKGYATRSRSSGGFDRICGIVMHHDADSTSGSDDSVLTYEYENADDRPIGNFHVQRDGDVWIGAAGASNHAGKGGPVSTSQGTVPLDAGNKFLIGIEASNNGIGEPWGTAILDSYLILVTELCKFYHLNPMTDIYAHWTWVQPSCPGRKIDPAGPTAKYPKFGGTSGANKWNMDEVRKEINARIQTTPSPSPEPPEDNEVTDDDVKRIADAVWKRMMTFKPTNKQMSAEDIMEWTAQYACNADMQTRPES